MQRHQGDDAALELLKTYQIWNICSIGSGTLEIRKTDRCYQIASGEILEGDVVMKSVLRQNANLDWDVLLDHLDSVKTKILASMD